MSVEKVRIGLIMALGAEIGDGLLGYEFIIGAMGTVTGRTILGRGRVHALEISSR